jgi:hypothetical protein
MVETEGDEDGIGKGERGAAQAGIRFVACLLGKMTGANLGPTDLGSARVKSRKLASSLSQFCVLIIV